MIPIRARTDSPITTSGVRPPLRPNHPLADTPCPVCDGPLTAEPITLVLVGFDPETRDEPHIWATGGSVAVHAACAGVDGDGDGDS
jgi:hypothetical protein